jgi:hypothetical protein
MPKPMLVCGASAVSPPAISETSKLVPPTSPVMTFGKPAEAAMWAAAMTPAAGPERAVRTGRAFAVSTVITPPFDCTISTWPRNPASPRLASSWSR